MKNDEEILKHLYNRKHTDKFYDVSQIYQFRNVNKSEVDSVVIAMEKNGFVERKNSGDLFLCMFADNQNPDDANNSICRISAKGIEYYEKAITRKRSTRKDIATLAVQLVKIVEFIFKIVNLCFHSSFWIDILLLTESMD